MKRKPREFATFREADRWARQHWPAPGAFSESERDAIDFYLSDGWALNADLRAKRALLPQDERRVQILNAIQSAHPTPEPIIVHRALITSTPWRTASGTRVTERTIWAKRDAVLSAPALEIGFMSTTLGPGPFASRPSRRYPGRHPVPPVWLRLTVPAGIPALSVVRFDYPHEHELLLARGLLIQATAMTAVATPLPKDQYMPGSTVTCTLIDAVVSLP